MENTKNNPSSSATPQDEITQLKKQLAAAQAENRMFRTIYDIIPFDIFVKDPSDDYRYVYCNRNFIESQGGHSEVIGQTDFEIFNVENDAMVLREHDTRVMQHGEPASYFESYIDEHSDAHSIISIKRPIDLTGDGHEVLLGTSVDTGKLPMGNREMAEAYVKLAFVDNVHHAVNTPLNIIMGFSEILDVCTEEERPVYVHAIHQNARLLRYLIDDMLYLSHRDIGVSGPRELSSLELVSFCRELHKVLAVAAPPHVDFKFVQPCEQLLCCSGRTRLSNILTNLITNAFKNTKSGHVAFTFQDLGDEIEFQVSDTGIGIEDKKLKNIFDRYVKLEQDSHGIGIGLAICKKMVKSLDGKIWAESIPGQGSTFHFTIKKQVPTI